MMKVYCSEQWFATHQLDYSWNLISSETSHSWNLQDLMHLPEGTTWTQHGPIPHSKWKTQIITIAGSSHIISNIAGPPEQLIDKCSIIKKPSSQATLGKTLTRRCGKQYRSQQHIESTPATEQRSDIWMISGLSCFSHLATKFEAKVSVSSVFAIMSRLWMFSHMAI